MALPVLSGKDLTARFKASREAVNEVKRRARAHGRMMDFEDKAERLERTLGRQINAITKAFEYLSTKVEKRMKNHGLTAVQIITPQVRDEIIEPYKEFLKKEFKSGNLDAAIEAQNDKRAKDLKTYGRTDELIKNINKYHDTVINKYLLPLRTIEAQFNSIDTLKGSGKFNAIEGRVTRLLSSSATDANVVEDTQEIG